jgi:hypothetical protein
MGRQRTEGWLSREREAWNEFDNARFCSVGAAVGAAVGLIGSSRSSKAANRATAAASEANAEAMEIERRKLAMAEEQYQRYKDVFQPIEDEFIQESRNLGSIAKQNESAQRTAADVAATFGAARTRLQETPGLQPGSQQALRENNRINLAEAATSAASQTAARTNVQDKATAAKGNLVNMGKGMPATAISSMSGSPFSQLAGGLTQQAAAAGRDAAAGWGAVANIAGRNAPAINNWLSSNFGFGGSSASPAAPAMAPMPDYGFGTGSQGAWT